MRSIAARRANRGATVEERIEQPAADVARRAGEEYGESRHARTVPRTTAVEAPEQIGPPHPGRSSGTGALPSSSVSASRALLLVFAVPVIAAGCGSSSHTTTTTSPPPLTEKQFVSNANAVCIKSDRRVFRLGRLSLLPEGWAHTAAAARQGVAEMSTVRPPVKAQAGFERLLLLGRRLATGIQHVHDALVTKNYKAAQAEQLKATSADTAIHLQAKKLGLTFCQQLLTNWPA